MKTIGFLEVLVERLAAELRDRRIRPRSAGAHVRFPEDLERARRRSAAIENVAFVIAAGALLAILVLVWTTYYPLPS